MPSISKWLPPTLKVAAPPTLSAETAFTSTDRLPPTLTDWLPPISVLLPLVICVLWFEPTLVELLTFTSCVKLLPMLVVLLFATVMV